MDEQALLEHITAPKEPMMSMAPTMTSEATIWNRVIQPDGAGLSAQAALSLLALSFSEGDKERMNELARKNRLGLISDEERQELACYVKVGDVLSLLHLKARKSLKQ